MRERIHATEGLLLLLVNEPDDRRLFSRSMKVMTNQVTCH